MGLSIPDGLGVRISASHSMRNFERGWPGFDSPSGSDFFFLFLYLSDDSMSFV